MTTGKRLAAVLRIRQIQERGARGELAVQRRRHRLAQVAERHTWAALDERAAAEVGAVRPSVGADSVLGMQVVAAAGVRAAGTQRHVTETAAVDLATAMEQWTIAARRVDGMERLADRVATSEEEERQRMVNNEIDDLVLGRFGRDGTGPSAAGARG